MGRKNKKSDESGGEEGCELASQASNSAHGEMKQRIMQLAREKGPLMYRGAAIHIYAEYSAEVARQRAAFTPIKSSLRNAGLAYSLLFPAKLRVVVDGTRHTFNSPAEVSAFLKRRQPAEN
ncbi:hypothetical protein KUCAC02_030562 [Chaenocephalus aceratus]|uniref:Uncharacterized protein n=1 Tax=Chaenocephalus aceratus TaxID=36190 RepID=A0ACB9XKE9_CHAAC|nr:hypothetical protein KUCAC02_030562 [Chaenocephalus aceratus]